MLKPPTLRIHADDLIVDNFAGGGVASLPDHLAHPGRRKHGLSYTPEYRAWQTMRLRCTVESNPAYADYGARGIRVCARWLGSVEAFVGDMGSKPSPKHEIDRVDNNAGYDCGKCDDCAARGVTKTNCRWATRKANDRNRRSNRFLEHRGERLTIAEWCERLGIPRDTVSKRLEGGWSIAEALETPVRPKAPNGSARRDRSAA